MIDGHIKILILQLAYTRMTEMLYVCHSELFNELK